MVWLVETRTDSDGNLLSTIIKGETFILLLKKLSSSLQLFGKIYIIVTIDSCFFLNGCTIVMSHPGD